MQAGSCLALLLFTSIAYIQHAAAQSGAVNSECL